MSVHFEPLVFRPKVHFHFDRAMLRRQLTHPKIVPKRFLNVFQVIPSDRIIRFSAELYRHHLVLFCVVPHAKANLLVASKLLRKPDLVNFDLQRFRLRLNISQILLTVGGRLSYSHHIVFFEGFNRCVLLMDSLHIFLDLNDI